MITQFDYRSNRYYVKYLHNLKSNENHSGEGILIGHSQMGEIEIPQCVAKKLFVEYLKYIKENDAAPTKS